MNETYIQVGNEASWVFAFLPVPALIVLGLNRRKLQQRPYLPWQYFAIAAYFFTTSFLGLPFEWVTAGACLGGAIYILAPKQSTIRPAQSKGLAMVYAILAVLFIGLGRFSGDNLTLTDSSARFSFLHRDKEVPRTGLKVTAVRGTLWFNIRPWNTWTSFSDTGSNHEIGPNISGFSIYWGPHGLITGDSLAMHFARWAKVTPSLQTKHGSKYVLTPLPEFAANR